MRHSILNSILFGSVLCVVSAAPADEVRLQGAGSTFVAPMMQRWVTEFQKIHPDAKIDYQSIGSGGGVKGFMDAQSISVRQTRHSTRKNWQRSGAARTLSKSRSLLVPLYPLITYRD